MTSASNFASFPTSMRLLATVLVLCCAIVDYAAAGPPAISPRQPVVHVAARTALANQVRFAPPELVPPGNSTIPSVVTPLPPPAEPDGTSHPIDLATALQLADANNPIVALAREQTRQAWALEQAAGALWLPSLAMGANYNKHEGAIQDTMGTVFNTSRNSLYGGSGVGIVGAGPPVVPGLSSRFHLADALFRPLAARQFARARGAAARAATNDTLLNVSLAYLELQRAAHDISIAEETLSHATRLAEITASYARTGQGLRSDADRAAVEQAIRRNDVARAQESATVASARLAQLLRLDPVICLVTVEPGVVPLDLVACDAPMCDLVAVGLTGRPELAESRLLVSEAVERLRREKAAPLVPSVLLGVSYGAFGGGIGDDVVGTNDRFNADAMLYWELRNLGVGDRTAQDAARSQVRQANLRQVATLDLVAREVVEAATQVQQRRQQVDIARQAVALGLDSYRLNLQRIEHAQGLPIEVLQSIQALLQARREYLRSVVDYNAAQFTLQRALGWQVDQMAVARP